MSSTIGPPPPSRQYWLDRRWIHDHYAQLVRDHPNQWVAVHRGQVMTFGSDLGVVDDAARSMCGAEDVVIQFIDDGSNIY